MGRNQIEVDPAKFPWMDLGRYTFSMATERNGVVYLSGQTAAAYSPEEGKVLCRGGLIEQTRLIYEKLGVVLEAAGMGFQHVVQTIDYLDPIALPQYRQTAEVRRQYLQGSPVASTGVCVERLLRPDALIEISAVAMRQAKRTVDPGWPRYQNLTYVPGVQAGDIVWLSGFMGSERVDGQPSYPQETARQMELAYQTLGQVLKAAELGPGDVVKYLDYVAPQALLQYPNSEAVRREFYNGHYPASTSVIANRLLRPEGHVEVESVAVKGGNRQEIRLPEWEQGHQELSYVPGVKKGCLLHLSGQSAVDHTSGATVAEFDVAAQADQAYRNISQVLSAAGYSLDDAVNTIEWIAPNGLMGYRSVQDVRRKYFGEDFPSATGVMVHRMLRSELLIEVTAVAVV